MKLRRVIEVLASGCVVYALAVACSGGGGGGGFLADAATGNGGGSGVGGFLADVFGDPVSEAHAAPPEIKEAPCTGSGNSYAEVAFPGKTVNELALAHVLRHTTTADNGYEWYAATDVRIKDGTIWVYCSYASTGSPVVDKVRVILPAP